MLMPGWQELVEHSPVPVLNALSSLWHPTQILADLLTLHEHAAVLGSNAVAAATAEADAAAADAADDAGGKKKANGNGKKAKKQPKPDELPDLPKGLTVAWVGDSTNILHDMLVAYPRLGMKVRVATPAPAAYQCPTPVWERVQALGCDKDIVWTSDPREAVHGADVIVTDTWYETR
jgi:ornithine carbamoyltransferase